MPPRDRFVDDHRQGIEVRACGDLAARRLLGRHEAGRTEHAASPGQLGICLDALRQPEVRHARLPRRIDQDVAEGRDATETRLVGFADETH